MKRVLSFSLVCLLLFSLCSCSSSKNDTEVNSIVASYSVRSTKKDFIVAVQDLGGVYSELYDTTGIYLKGADNKIYDIEGNKISRDDLTVGDSLEIQYDGTLAKKNPKTIKVIKIVKIS